MWSNGHYAILKKALWLWEHCMILRAWKMQCCVWSLNFNFKIYVPFDNLKWGTPRRGTKSAVTVNLHVSAVTSISQSRSIPFCNCGRYIRDRYGSVTYFEQRVYFLILYPVASDNDLFTGCSNNSKTRLLALSCPFGRLSVCLYISARLPLDGFSSSIQHILFHLTTGLLNF